MSERQPFPQFSHELLKYKADPLAWCFRQFAARVADVWERRILSFEDAAHPVPCMEQQPNKRHWDADGKEGTGTQTDRKP